MDLDEEKTRQPLRVLSDLQGYSAVWLPGSPSHLIIKPSTNQPQIVPLAVSSIQSLCPFNTPSNPKGFAYISNTSTMTAATLPIAQTYTTGLATTRIPINHTVNALTYHAQSKTYILSLLNAQPFKLPHDPSLRTQIPDNEPLLPTLDHSTLALFDRSTTTVVQTIPLDPYETILSLKTLDLEVSETMHTRSSLVVVGTAITRGEDLATLGRIYIYSVIPVVPEPGRPETGQALKLVCKEEVRGAVTAISAVGTQGLVMMAQGQKILVRGLKEDGSLLPVAFMDCQVHTTVCKELKGSGLVVVGDAVNGLWFVGYTVRNPPLSLYCPFWTLGLCK